MCVALLKFPGDLPGVVMRQAFSLFFPRGVGSTGCARGLFRIRY